MNVPPAAFQAAAEALLEFPDPPTRFERDRWRIVMRMSLEAAAPLIRAAERERIAKLAEQHDVCYLKQVRTPVNTMPPTVNLENVRMPFADLVREEEPT